MSDRLWTLAAVLSVLAASVLGAIMLIAWFK